MEHFLISLLAGSIISGLTLWLFFYLGNREKKLAFMEMEEVVQKKGDESLSLLLQQCQSEEEREIVYNFAKEQMEKDNQKVINNQIVNTDILESDIAIVEKNHNNCEKAISENQEDQEYTRILDKNSLI